MTEKYILDRGAGKTTILLARSAATKAPIVCKSEQSAEYLKERAALLGLNIPEPITLDNLQKGAQVTEVLVDDADVIVKSLIEQATGASVIAMTFSRD